MHIKKDITGLFRLNLFLQGGDPGQGGGESLQLALIVIIIDLPARRGSWKLVNETR